ncbi:uncharacterized protein LOC143861434 [Tasmannia lanceolata]|uniref:uncharacterized protein LOC143861434 n=1 Tax=Tasmannia lanceolata TaxID=3420 RepID=UPI0040632035
MDDRCPLCNSKKETINHLFFRCGFSTWVWRSILWRYGSRRKLKKTIQDEEEWLRIHCRSKSQSSTAMKIAFASAIYRLWRERNLRIFEKKSNHKTRILRFILHDVLSRVNSLTLWDSNEVHKVAVANHFGYKLSVKEKELQFCCWLQPELGEFKLNTDASLVDEGGGIGGILRNKDGEIIHVFSENNDGDEIFALEIQAICEGVAVAKSLGLTSLWIEANSSFAVNSFNKRYLPLWKKIPSIQRA